MWRLSYAARVFRKVGPAFRRVSPEGCSPCSCFSRRTFLTIGTCLPCPSNIPFLAPSVSRKPPSSSRKVTFRRFSGDTTADLSACSDSEESTESAHLADSDTLAVDQFLDALDGKRVGWWPLYVRGEVPDYPPRREMFERLTSEGIDVERMEAFEVEDFTRWLLMRKKHGPGYPRMPYDMTLEQKIRDLRRRIPLESSNKSDK